MQKPKVKDTIASLKRLWQDLMGEYQDLVFPYGFSDVPVGVSLKANEVMNHAENVRKKLEALEDSIGIVRKRKRNRPSKVIVAQRLSIAAHKDKSLAWAIEQLAEKVDAPKCYLQARQLACRLEFLDGAEEDEMTRKELIDQEPFAAWFDDKFKTSVLYTLQFIDKMGNVLAIKGDDPCEAALNFLYKFINSDGHKQAYLQFRDKYFGDSQGII